MLGRILIWFTWIWAVVFVPIETYITWSTTHNLLNSGYAVNVLGVVIMLWGVVSLRGARPYAEGVLATGWGWTTAVFWRGANLRYWLAAEDKPLSYGPMELWLAPIFTVIAATALLCALVLLVRRHKARTDSGTLTLVDERRHR
jgi:hypothetical protein